MHLSRLLACGLALFCITSTASAFEMASSLGVGWWQYEENLNATPGNAASPLHSRAHGWGIIPALELSQVTDSWIGGLSVKGLLPLNRTNERWTLPGSVQTNSLDVLELDAGISLAYTWRNIRFGGWVDYVRHEQKRRDFFVNGIRKTVAGEPVRELVQSSWIGIKGSYRLFSSRLTLLGSAGWPVYAHMTNTSIGNKIFSHVSGYRWRVGGDWRISGGMGEMETVVSASYQLRYLAGESPEKTPSWPANTWQQANLGLTARW